MARVITTGIVSIHIEKPSRAFEVDDVGGQRNERRKRVGCFANVNCLMFVVNLAGYATVTYEDASMNRMTEAMNAFKATVNNRVFNDTKICLVFNKKDAFENMLLKKPLKETFPDYEGPNCKYNLELSRNCN
ncbi:hypothetical protein SARC_07376 [Sphaeroforma arctica JP610]|uniref:G-protein alpha subunit n=1 Tax=Sphaeroforma arctica JP610 TaxID=667725 RepID=A0A0L0FUN5_9EUKA|nr:hypothetical protein SARC_07376 [Sphaeroforma arctica JP610]KNC80266.1 hypothetical protein SARC_07376 [Sphaeroforma arctica JP610]|eukprot:XP_014154168.1 hypothetical protein SARC_07376 [Sphaeroforma arctica JP610]